MPQKKVTFAVGQGFDKDGKSIPQLTEKVNGVLKIAAGIFGGYSMSVVTGGWINSARELITEPSLNIVVFTDLPVATAHAFAEELAVVFNQESVMLAIEPVDMLEFVGQGER